MSVGVIVIGDLGHSPRMQNHTLAFAKHSKKSIIHFIGYSESGLPKEITESSNIKVHKLSNCIQKYLSKLPRIFFLLYAFLKILIEIIQLFFILLCCTKKLKYIILQVILLESPFHSCLICLHNNQMDKKI